MNTNISKEKFNYAKEKAEVLYKQLNEIYCPYFKEKIICNSKGLEHIKFKSRNKQRSKPDQYGRFRLFKYIPLIISNSHTLQGKRFTKGFELTQVNSRHDLLLKDIRFYEFIAVLDEYRIRIVIKQIENGSKFFWSIIPFSNNINKKHHPEGDVF